MKIDKDFILYELTDEEIQNMTDEEYDEFDKYIEEHGLNEAMTIKGLLKRNGFKYDDLPKWVQDFYVDVCNNINRTEKQIYINRPNSIFKDNIVINLNPNREVPFMTCQTHIVEANFIHEEGYDEDGTVLYEA